ncbi:citrate/2-methylcitrate synthase [Neorickettsia findlayensis]|uniref:Citrate synthase n=1 Tax=Neorickettsia findlayensis TaxID=2686014 RepID=A0A6P1GA84_9RICK|nr:citrate/2-methylcitrate synthase [Neorickettsia findlayensis]QHD65387.1 citrate (Si)-synthase [Neorickettsia findlayensis]
MNSEKVKVNVEEFLKSTAGPFGVSVSLEPKGFFYDPGYAKTAPCKSSITFIDGEKGILLHRGYSIEELARTSNFLQVGYLLINGKLPDSIATQEFEEEIKHVPQLPECVLKNIRSFPTSVHPMAVLISAFASLASVHGETDFHEKKLLLVAYTPWLVAYIYRHINSQEFIEPDTRLPYAENFLYMMFGEKKPEDAEILDKIFILHADHGQTASTSVARMVVSSGASPIAACSAAAGSLWGPLHGGANERVLEMLRGIIENGGNVENFIERVKKKEERLMGFGHRVYKNYDPRAAILKQKAHSVLKADSPVLNIAGRLETIAASEEYFLSRKLYPNVDFYSGIVLDALGIPSRMFTAIFALARTVGWVAQIAEFLSDSEQKLCRPRQIYVGEPKRSIHD